MARVVTLPDSRDVHSPLELRHCVGDGLRDRLSRRRAARSLTRATMSSRTNRIRSIPSMPRSDGSSVSQFSNWVPGTGSMWASRPSVTTTSTSWTIRGSIDLGVWSVMSTPTSLSTSAESVLTAVPGLIHLHGVARDLAHQAGRHLRLAGVLDADEQHGRLIHRVCHRDSG